MIHEMFRGLERTIHERLEIIEEMVRRGALGTTATEPCSDATSQRLETLERQQRIDNENTQALLSRICRGNQYVVSRIDALEEELRQLRSEKPSNLIPPHPLVGIEIVPKKEVVLTEQNPERINEADRLLLNSSARTALEEEEHELDGELEGEVEDELEVVEEVEDEETQVEEVEEEEEAEELEEFEYKGATYYRDGEKNVFMTDEDGELVPTPIGVWSEVKKRIIIKKADA
jgi:hypothetical protein